VIVDHQRIRPEIEEPLDPLDDGQERPEERERDLEHDHRLAQRRRDVEDPWSPSMHTVRR